MDYKSINRALAAAQDVGTAKTGAFYKYLLNNNLAYYYARVLSKKRNHIENRIIKKGEEFNACYHKTLKFVKELCQKNKIDFLVFKTHKHIPEAVDGDVDLIVKGVDYTRFLRLLGESGFSCYETGPQKAVCIKRDFKKIEPRVNLAFGDQIVLAEKEIWRHTKQGRTLPEVDIYYQLLNVLYGPGYFKLYHYLVLKSLEEKDLLFLADSRKLKSDLRLVVNQVNDPKKLGERLPIFIDNATFIKWWWRRGGSVKSLMFFFYSKLGYYTLNRLPFSHDWGITNV